MSNRIQVAMKSLNELGLTPMFWLLVYRGGLFSRLWRFQTPALDSYPDFLAALQSRYPEQDLTCRFPFPIPKQQELLDCIGEHTPEAIREADEIIDGNIRIFGNYQTSLDWSPYSSIKHWSEYELHHIPYPVDDVKLIWEPGRMGWGYTLCRAYLITGNEKYPESFWQHTKAFLNANPPNQGPHWTSSQEVALRLLALLFTNNVFSHSNCWTNEKKRMISNAVIAHAARIPPTLSYARAQNNNHLLTEALGLYAAGISLPRWPDSQRWKKLGWELINLGIQKQISTDGTYVQQSTNYHRLMLQVLIWAQVLAESQNQVFPSQSIERIHAAIEWLLAQLDFRSGQVPNLGNNDGAYIFPLASGGQNDYRPVLQAALRTFPESYSLPDGPWDELSLWAGKSQNRGNIHCSPIIECSAVHKLGDENSWASLRAVQYDQRPAHADQLHVDLWWKGINIALDAGTYSYNHPKPWNNALKHTIIHNTVTINQRDQMTAAGQFLWLDWAQANIIQKNIKENIITAEHHGYRSINVLHRRSLQHPDASHWLVTDQILPYQMQTDEVEASVHWLLPDYPWTIVDSKIEFTSPAGKISLAVSPNTLENEYTTKIKDIQLIRAGEVLYGTSSPTAINRGWYSPEYYSRLPALSFLVDFSGQPPFSVTSTWQLEG